MLPRFRSTTKKTDDRQNTWEIRQICFSLLWKTVRSFNPKIKSETDQQKWEVKPLGNQELKNDETSLVDLNQILRHFNIISWD